jgi:ABC-2 type transport system ATP-binding protein
MIRSMVAEGRTVVLSSRLLDEVEKICDVAAIVDRGHIVAQGPAAAGTGVSPGQRLPVEPGPVPGLRTARE